MTEHEAPPHSPHRTPSRLRRGAVVLGALALIYLVLAVAQTISDPKQWDLAVYRHAAATIAAGQDPYDPQAALAPRRPGEMSLPFVYPPHIAALLAACASSAETLPLGADARRVDAVFLSYLIAKLLTVALLLVLWQRFLLHTGLPQRLGRGGINPRDRWATMASLLFLAVLAFRETLLRDLYSGNVSLFEQAALWTAFLLLLHHRWIAFASATALAAVAKLTPVVFLALSFLMPRHGTTSPGLQRRTLHWRIAAPLAALGALLAIVLLGHVATPWSLGEWWQTASSLDERGRMNPSSLALWRDLASGLGLRTTTAALAAYAASSVVVVFVSVIFLRRYAASASERILVCTLAAALVLPRFKDYAYVLLVPAAWWVLNRVEWRLRVALLVLLCVHVWDYQPLLSAAVLWLCTLRLSKGAQRPGAPETR